MDFWDRLEQVRARNDVLGHSFYRRWSSGELTRPELARYAGEYRVAVVALADASDRAARTSDRELAPVLAAHAAEEREHIELWDAFAHAVGADLELPPLPETSACARAWTGASERPLLESLVALYAIESGQPAIAQTKREGLRAHYGVVDPAATAYFDLHVERDVEHAAQGRELIERRLAGADEARLLAEAESVLRANWELLDGVERV